MGTNLIIILLLSALVYGIRFMLWKEEVPSNIEKSRWVIGFVITIVALIIGVAIDTSDGSQLKPGSHVIYLFLLFSITGALKNPKHEKNNKDIVK